MTEQGRTLVLGATGAVGSALVGRLVPTGRDVRIAVRRPETARAVMGDVEVVQGDLTDIDSLARAMNGCTTVFHAAGLPEQWLQDDRLFETVNVQGTRNAVAAAMRANVSSFVYTSTIDVFARTPGVAFDESRLDPLPQGTAYERSKQAADLVVADAIADGLPARFLHPAALYGRSAATTVSMNAMITRLAGNRLPLLPPGGVPLVHRDDVASGHLAAEGAPIGSRYILSDRYVPFADLVTIIQTLIPNVRRPPGLPRRLARPLAITGQALARATRRPPLLPAGQLHFMTSHVVPDSTRARTELGWRPRPLEQSLADLLDAP
ncbi:NAD-dependent epimerase/dehydratase family protein [Streptomyces sp. NBC_01589]|uniref:NAD-dependent epimerase/dehydratase family protein n=1 Tax=Streptomyces sp. NBC_01589 TaxID=2975886 RepID=UPI0038637DBF